MSPKPGPTLDKVVATEENPVITSTPDRVTRPVDRTAITK